MPVGDEAAAQVGADEPGRSGDEDAFSHSATPYMGRCDPTARQSSLTMVPTA